MNQRWRRAAPVLAAALGFTVLAWLVTSVSLSGHRLVTPGSVPDGLPPKALEYLPEGFADDFPEDVDLAADSAGDLPPELLDELGDELTAAELAELSRVLSDDLIVELAEHKAGSLSPEEIQTLWEGLDPETRERLLDEIGGTYTQEELDRIADRLSPELYEELSDRAGSEPDTDTGGEPSGEPTSDPGDTDTGESATPPASDPAQTGQAEPSGSDAAAEKTQDSTDSFGWLRDLGEFAMSALKWLLILGVVAVACYMLFRIVVALTGWRPRRRAAFGPAKPPARDAEPGPEVGRLREAVAEGLSDVSAAADPRLGVIECWQRLEHAAAAAGLARLDSETPGELVERVLTAAKVDAAALNDLADTYRQARYGPHEIGEDLRERAVAALAAVDGQLAAAASVPESV